MICKKNISLDQLRAIRKNYAIKSVRTVSRPTKIVFRTKTGERVSFLAKKVYKKSILGRR